MSQPLLLDRDAAAAAAAAAATPPWLQRSELLVGEEGLHRLDRARVLLVGLGGVGSFAAEFLVRQVGSLVISLVAVVFIYYP